DEPPTVFARSDGNFFNFDDTATNATNAIKFTIRSDQRHFIRNMKTSRKGGLAIFTSDGEFECNADGQALTPTNIVVKLQSDFGCSTVPIAELDGEIVFNTANHKEVRRYDYR